jgi:M6 family metalloprotease-like protein
MKFYINILLAASVIVMLSVCAAGTAVNEQDPAYSGISLCGLEKPAVDYWPRNISRLHVVIVFTKFKGEAPGDSLAPYWAKDIFDGFPGSVNDYFKAISFGQYNVSGEYLPRRYEMPHDSTYYRSVGPYTQDIIRMLDEDPSISLASYDNDGADGIPNSIDDDGYVDYLVLMPMSRPYGFIMQGANGIANLQLSQPYFSHETRPTGEHIMVDMYSGNTSVAATKGVAIGTIVHEISHAYGGEDLADMSYPTPESDSGGAGCWDSLARGALGWNYSGIPTPPGAYNRICMNSAGLNNSNLVDLFGSGVGARMKPSGDPDGKIYRIDMNNGLNREYFLIEYRNNSSSLFYDYQIPRNGILIWHIVERESNDTEEKKLCDLECADGKYRDAGYPIGIIPDPVRGGDNLDFWAHDYAYAAEHAGNLGDATDVYDGVTYTAFGAATNPNNYSHEMMATSAVEIFNIHREGEEMVFDYSSAFSPRLKPPKLPVVGAGFQRSKSKNPTAEPSQKAVYLAVGGLNSGSDLMVQAAPDTLSTFDVSSLGRAARDRMAESFLLEGEDLKSAEMVRKNISPAEFAAALRVFDLHPSDLATGGSFSRLQKITLRARTAEIPFVMKVLQNYPNPFNARTSIPYILSRPGRVTLEVFDILGRKVFSREEGFRSAGSHAAVISSENLASGVYFYRFGGAAQKETRRFVIVR